ncbi:aspartyl/asparaginyl beta-hydroxylase domain-containing protein [Marilutibacter chinensis]|uniref:Aspartyl/asparaginyl beta-hydroxylase domain-containing protein n=1 Tax=Marilutibacter chinensis TaxID=2912247 RepID=A0ABS9HXF4_9GAMM|nr:aspartyl/asparaginyl beta-hydroxylase domain-containing protein [Lysobacter chinensis]MCF7222712.1 aspartyl/asparaginyl beta-hydroxylase domain-containing protein [Lysobacter chinensis]
MSDCRLGFRYPDKRGDTVASGIEEGFGQRIAAATDVAAVVDACRWLEAEGRGRVDPQRLRQALPALLHAHLARITDHPAFRLWLDAYFGRRPAAFRSRLQQPGYLYYPALEPRAWFDIDVLPELAPLVPRIPAVRDELLAVLANAGDFSPYVSAEAARSRTWAGLADRPDWSALHLLRRGEWHRELMARLPLTDAFLAGAPLAQYPPHAPECFVSRLKPGVVLPPHHGLSNIKLTVHLPVDLPPTGCDITVAGETRIWRDGEFLVFDDSFLHSAANRSDRDRTVMIFDVWHPHLSEDERAALAHAIAVLDAVQSAIARLAGPATSS